MGAALLIVVTFVMAVVLFTAVDPDKSFLDICAALEKQQKGYECAV